MENTIDNAKDFLTKWRDERTHPVSTDYFAELMVAYASSVQSEPIKLPRGRQMKTSDMDKYEQGKVDGRNQTIEEIKRLNPITQPEEKKEGK